MTNDMFIRSAVHLLEKNESEAHQQFDRAMKWLWDCIAEPILLRLGYHDAIQDGAPWPRVWWIPVGLFSLFPIHAAGDYLRSRHTGEPCTVLDRVISSYSPTVKALLYAHERIRTLNSNTEDEKPIAMIVGMEKTSGFDQQLTNVPGECKSVQMHLKKTMTTDVLMNPGRDEVLSGLKRCTITHFACHAVSDQRDPSKSELILRDWKRNPLNFRSLLKTRFSRCRFAYLSACGSGENKNLEFNNENVNLIGGFQLADVPAVIGTSWRIGDLESAMMVERFYSALLKDNAEIATGRTAEALHQAVRYRRDQGDKPLNWGAFVHYGV